MKPGNRFIVIALLVLLASTAALAADKLEMQIPIRGESGVNVRVLLLFDSPLVSGQKMNLYSNDVLACSLSPGGFGIAKLVTGVIMTEPGSVKADIVDKHGKVSFSVSKPFEFTVKPPAPTTGGAAFETKQVKAVLRGKNEARLYYPKIKGNTQVKYETGAGRLTVLMTPYLQKTFNVTSDRELGNVSVTAGSPEQ